MKINKKYLIHTFFGLFTLLFLLLALGQITYRADWPERPFKEELYEPELAFINSLDVLEAYCDELYESLENKAGMPYPEIVNEVVKRRFLHGYSYFHWRDNYVAYLLSFVTKADAHAIVLPDDILRYPQGACSQQAIVMMALLRRKGLPVRKVGLFDPKEGYGHFVLEAQYDGRWHLFDPNMEPSLRIVKEDTILRYSARRLREIPAHVYGAYQDTSIARLIVHEAYTSYGEVNAPPAPNATLYQQVSQALSNSLWLWALLVWGGYVFRERRKQKKQAEVLVRES